MKKTPSGQFLLGALALAFAALFTGCPSKPTQTAAEPSKPTQTAAEPSTPTPIATELKPLQGSWEGEGPPGKISITITGNSLHYYARPDHWFKTTFTLPAGTDPQQLHATIKDCGGEPPKPIGEVVVSIFKIEDGTLTFASPSTHNAEPPKSFEDEAIGSLTVVRKVQPPKMNTEPPKTQ